MSDQQSSSNRQKRGRWVDTYAMGITAWIAIVGTISALIFMTVVSSKLNAERAMIEEQTVRIKDLEVRIDEISKKVCLANQQ